MAQYQPDIYGLYPFPASRIADPFTHNKVNILKTLRLANSLSALPDAADYVTYDLIRLNSGTIYVRTEDVTWEEWPSPSLMLNPSETDYDDPVIGNIYYNTVLEYYRVYDGVSWVPATMKYTLKDGVNNGIADITLLKFVPGYTELYVYGKQGFWFPYFDGSTQYMFTEETDGEGDYTILRPRYTMGAGPYFIRYVRDL